MCQTLSELKVKIEALSQSIRLHEKDLELVKTYINENELEFAFRAIIDGIGWNSVSAQAFELLKQIGNELELDSEVWEEVLC